MSAIPLTIIIPVYNTAQWLGACLESVTGQDLKEIEIICVDDRSTDRSPGILAQFAEKDPRIRILTHETNRGTLAARKTGVMAAGGDYIMLMDSDDTLDQGLCSSVYTKIQERGTDILEFPVRKVNTETGAEILWKSVAPPPDGENVLSWLYSQKNFHWNLFKRIYRSDVCKKAYSEIPDVRCDVADDALASFFISYYAGSYSSEQSECMYTYYYGRGISSQQHMPIEKFRQYCEMAAFPRIISDFLQRVNGDENAYKALKHFTVRLISDTCENYQSVADAEKAAAMDLFIAHWGKYPELPEGMMYRCLRISENKDSEIRKINKKHKKEIDSLNKRSGTEFNELNSRHKSELNEINKRHKTELNKKDKEIGQLKASIELVYRSRSYKLGNFLIRPIHALKALLHMHH